MQTFRKVLSLSTHTVEGGFIKAADPPVNRTTDHLPLTRLPTEYLATDTPTIIKIHVLSKRKGFLPEPQYS